MNLKILHTSDVHIGMKFNSYPDHVKEKLVEARFSTLINLIENANNEQCNMFIIAGDLFEKTTLPKKDIERVIKILDSFAGDCVLVLPGNHDFSNGLVELWEVFQSRMSDKIVLLNENKVCSLKETHDLDVVIYPASCNKKHGKENNLGWISEIDEYPEAKWHIGIAHGALEGLSPDLNGEYFSMSRKDLEALPIDLWLLGHTHTPFPQEIVTDGKIFNAGVPEPDGMDCKHEGYAWLIEIDEKKMLNAKRLKTGEFRFIDTELNINDVESFEKINQDYLTERAAKILLRLKIKGRIDQDFFNQKEAYYEELSESLTYFKPDDSELVIKITSGNIDKEFTHGSFPHRLLTELFEDNEEEALQAAYDLIQEVKSL